VAVYGDSHEELEESDLPNPSNPYGASKLAAEDEARRWAAEGRDRAVMILRPCVVFGEGNTANMFSLIQAIDKGLYVQFGRGDAIKSICCVHNLVDATLWCLARMKPGVELFNYVDKEDLCAREIAAIIARSLGKRSLKVAMPLWLGTSVGRCFDLYSAISGKNLRISASRVRKLATSSRFSATKIREAGFTPRYTIEEGLGRMVEWYLEEGRDEASLEFKIGASS
jgi:nucleoside-diphosphate-sugar epimerase